jgi:hypothetical protein
VPFLAVLAGVTVAWIARRDPRAAWMTAAALATVPLQTSVNTDLFIRHTDTRTLAADYITAQVPSGASVLLQPYSVVLEPTADALREAVARSGKAMPTKTQLQIARDPYPAPAYRLIYIGEGMDADKLYLPLQALQDDPIGRLRAEHVAFLVLKRYNDEAPALLPLTAGLARDGRRLAVFSPYREGAATRPEPFLHNTDARITAALERSGPVVEIWRLNGAR